MRSVVSLFVASVLFAGIMAFGCGSDPWSNRGSSSCYSNAQGVIVCSVSPPPAPSPPAASPGLPCTYSGGVFTQSGLTAPSITQTCAPFVPPMQTSWGKSGSKTMQDATMNKFFVLCRDDSAAMNVTDAANSEKSWAHAVGRIGKAGCWAQYYTNLALGADYVDVGCTGVNRNDHPRMDNYDVAATQGDSTFTGLNMFQHDPSLHPSPPTPTPSSSNRNGTGNAAGSNCTRTSDGAIEHPDLEQLVLNRTPYVFYSAQLRWGTLLNDGGILAANYKWTNTPAPGEAPTPSPINGVGCTLVSTTGALTPDCYYSIYEDQFSCGNGRGGGGGLFPASGPPASMELDPTMYGFDGYTGCFPGVEADSAAFMSVWAHAKSCCPLGSGTIAPFYVWYNGISTLLDNTPISLSSPTDNTTGHGVTCSTTMVGPSNVMGGGIEGVFLHFAQPASGSSKRGANIDTAPQAINCVSDMAALGKATILESYDRNTIGDHEDWRVYVEAAYQVACGDLFQYCVFGDDLYDGSQNCVLCGGNNTAEVHPENGLVALSAPLAGVRVAFTEGGVYPTYQGNGSFCPSAGGASGGGAEFVVRCGTDIQGNPAPLDLVEYSSCSYFGVIIGPCGFLINLTDQNQTIVGLSFGQTYAHIVDCNQIITNGSTQPQCNPPYYSGSTPATPAPIGTDHSFFDGTANGQTGAVINFGDGTGAGGSMCSTASAPHPYGNVPAACPTWNPSYVLPKDGGALFMFHN